MYVPPPPAQLDQTRSPLSPSALFSARIDPMAATCKRPAVSLDGHASQPGAMCRKRRRVIVGTTYDYDQESRLGQGKFGVVVKARCRATHQLVAIKLLHDTADPREVLREARFLEACGGHPHIVGFRGVTLDYVTDELCLVMDYIEGQSLKLLLSERRRGLPETTVRTFMWQLLTAAKEMHRCHIVHRDINPANILVGGEEAGRFVKICDFGVAMSMSEAPPYKEEAGMGEYRAPEMLLGKEDYDALVDTWSLGCVMAEMLTAERLFRAAEFISLFQRIFEVLGVRRATRHDVAGVHVAAARRPAAAGAGAAEHAARSVPGGDAVCGGIRGPQRSSYMQPRQAADGGRRTEAPVVRHCCRKRPPRSSCCSRQARHDGGVHKGGGGGVRSVDACQKESHGQDDVDQEEGAADRSTSHMKAQRSSSSASIRCLEIFRCKICKFLNDNLVHPEQSKLSLFKLVASVHL